MSQKSKSFGEDPLASAIEDWRASDETAEHLSGAARTRVLATVRASRSERGAPAPLRMLFPPLWRWTLAGALPLAALTLALGFLVLERPAPLAPMVSTSPSIQVSKAGDQVVFVIANGQTAHRVYKSNVPNEFPGEPVVTTDGSFRDRLEGGANLVFYRIE